MIDKILRNSLIDKHILCFGQSPSFLIQNPLRIEWFGSYSSLHGSTRLTSAVNAYMYASVSQHSEPVLRIISNHHPAINISLDKPSLDHEKGSGLDFIYPLIQQLKQHRINLQSGLNIFIESETKHGFHFGSSTGFILIILEAILFASKNKLTLSDEEKLNIIQTVEQHHLNRPIHVFDALSMLYGGSNLYEIDSENHPLSQRHQGNFKQFKIISLSLQNFIYQQQLSIKNILDQMNIIAQHYHQQHLMQVDSLTFHHEEQQLALLYGTKAIAKANHFFLEKQALKQAFLALDKEDEISFFNLFTGAQKRDIELLEHHLVSSPSELKIASTMKWLKSTFPQIAYRLHGFGFQADFLLLVPNDSYRDTLTRLKKQFYQDQVKEIRIVNQGIRIFKN